MADVQRTGRVGGDELDQRRRVARRLMAEARGRREHFADHGLPGRGLQADVDEAGAGDLQRVDPALERGLRLQLGDQRLRQFARVLLQRLGQLHRRGTGEVAVGGLLGVLEGGRGRGGDEAGVDGLLAQALEHGAEGGEQFLLGLDHGAAF